MKIYVQFNDAGQTEIISAFGSLQDVEVWPNQGEVDSTDARWQTYANKFPPGTFDNINP